MIKKNTTRRDKKNAYAKDLRQPKYRSRIVTNKKRKLASSKWRIEK